MKKWTLFATMLMCCMAVVAQTSPIFFADFEGWNEEGSLAFTSRGWTVIEDDDSNSKDKWKVAYSEKGQLVGNYSVTAGAWDETNQPNDEWLITPEIDLTNESAKGYCLDFIWQLAPAGIQDGAGKFRAYVKVQVVGTDTWDIILDFTDKDMVELSGVKWGWGSWSINNSVLI